MKEQTVTQADDGIRLDRWFKRHCAGVPHAMLEKHLRKGMVRIDGKKAESSTRVAEGQTLRFPEEWTTMEPGAPPKAKRWQPSEDDIAALLKTVLHRDEHILVLNKPSGLAVQGGTGQGKNLDDMLDGLRFDAKERPKLVHRLDKDTSGVIVLARSAKVAAELSRRFAQKELQKTYLALVNGMPMPMSGTIDMPLAKIAKGKDSRMHSAEVYDPDERNRERAQKANAARMAREREIHDAYEEMGLDEEAGKRAITEYRVVEHLSNRLSWVSLNPVTGRTHQLRVHMALIGHPIVGDGKYGGREAFVGGINLSRTLHLHAAKIEIPGFHGRDIAVRAPLPPHMQDSAKELQFDYKKFK